MKYTKKGFKKGFFTVEALVLGTILLAGLVYIHQKTTNEVKLGATVYTTQLSDTMNTFRLQVNSSTANLNTELSTVSSTVINLSSTLNLVPIANGGTGTSTTPLPERFLVGNGSRYELRQFVASSGLTLTTSSNSWTLSTQAIDTSQNFTWTGTHTFTNALNATGTSNKISITTATSTATTTDSFNLLPAGVIQMYAASTTSPAGWLFADGSSYATSSYPRLFAVIGYTYGGSTSTFNVPDLRGRNAIGYGSTTSSIDQLGETGGELVHLMTESELVAHTHSINKGDSGSGGNRSLQTNTDSGTFTSGSTGGSTPFNVLDPYIVVSFIIKY